MTDGYWQCASCEKRVRGVDERGAEDGEEFGVIERRRRQDRGAKGAEGVGRRCQKRGFCAFWVLFLPLSCLFYKRKPMILALGLVKLRIYVVYM